MKNEASLVIPAMRTALRFFILHRQAQTSRLSFIFPNNKKSSKCEAKNFNEISDGQRETLFLEHGFGLVVQSMPVAPNNTRPAISCRSYAVQVRVSG